MDDPRAALATRSLLLLAVAQIAIHLLLSGRYGYFIDELYFVAGGERLAWGYVDYPPLVAAVSRFSRIAFGETLLAIRLVPAFAGALLILLTGMIARDLGGGRFAQIAAGLTAFFLPVNLLCGGLLTMNAFEPALWMVLVVLLLRMVQGADRRWWIAVGVVVGVAWLNKYSVVFFAGALLVGLAISPYRRLLVGRWPLLGAALALVIALPNIVWQASHGWPFLEVQLNAGLYQRQPVTPLEFLIGQIVIAGPGFFPIWLAGLGFLATNRTAAPFRFLAWGFVVLFVLFLAMEAKSYYLGPVYPMMLAAGCVVIERAARRPRLGWLRAVAMVGIFALGMVPVPFVLPVVPVSELRGFFDGLGMKAVQPERRETGSIPQVFADMFGWRALIRELERASRTLSDEERSRAVIWGSSYGEAAAVDVLGRGRGLPPAVSGHMNYHLWGPGDWDGSVALAVGIGLRRDNLVRWFRSVEEVGALRCELCMPDRRVQPIYLCRGLRVSVPEFWGQIKCWNCPPPSESTSSAAAAGQEGGR